MSCTNMNSFEDQVQSMSSSQKTAAANAGFNKMNNMPSPQRADIILGMCAASNLYSLDISTMPEINNISDLSDFINEADSLDKSEKFEAGLKSFFTINYSPTTDRDEMFLGIYASASLSGVDINAVRQGPIDDVVVGPVDTVW